MKTNNTNIYTAIENLVAELPKTGFYPQGDKTDNEISDAMERSQINIIVKALKDNLYYKETTEMAEEVIYNEKYKIAESGIVNSNDTKSLMKSFQLLKAHKKFNADWCDGLEQLGGLIESYNLDYKPSKSMQKAREDLTKTGEEKRQKMDTKAVLKECAFE